MILSHAHILIAKAKLRLLNCALKMYYFVYRISKKNNGAINDVRTALDTFVTKKKKYL